MVKGCKFYMVLEINGIKSWVSCLHNQNPVYALYAYQVDSDMAKGVGAQKRILCIPRLFIREFPINKAMWAYIVKNTNAYQVIPILVCEYYAYQNR